MKNLIIALMLFLGAISYGQTVRAVVTEYTNSSGEKIFLHKSAASTPSGRCEFGALPRFELTDQYDMISANLNGVDILRIDPNLRNRNSIDDEIDYRWVSEADRLAFRNDITEGRDRLADPDRYRTRDGRLSFDTPCGTISARAFLEGQPDWDSTRSTVGAHYFGTVADTYITVQNNGFMVEIVFGNAVPRFESFDNAVDAYNRIQYLLSLRPFERELIFLGFIDEMHLEYEWNQQCSGTTTRWNWRVDIQGDRINLRDGKLGFTSTDLSIDVAMQRIRGRANYCQ